MPIAMHTDARPVGTVYNAVLSNVLKLIFSSVISLDGMSLFLNNINIVVRICKEIIKNLMLQIIKGL